MESPDSSSSVESITSFQNLRIKFTLFASMFASIFRDARDKDKYPDQQVELIKGGIKPNHGLHQTKEGGIKKVEEGSEEEDGSKEYINFGQEDQMEIKGFCKSIHRTIITWLFIILTLGILRLIFHWWPRLMLYATHVQCPLKKAHTILAIEHYQKKYKRYHVKPVCSLRATDLFKIVNLPGGKVDHHLRTFSDVIAKDLQSKGVSKLIVPYSDGSVAEAGEIRYFACKKLRYIWDDSSDRFFKLQGLDVASTALIHQASGLSTSSQYLRQLIYGYNEIKVEVQSITKLLFLEVLNPFYVFQIFSVTLWMSDNYIYFATAIIIMSVFGIISTIIQTRANQKKLKTTVQSSDVVTVCRESGEFETIPAELLVPGDVIVIPPHGCIMNCDAALLTGNCIVNESMLTGESVPVTKIPLPNRSDVIYNSKEHARHTLFCGTQVLQTRYYGRESVRAVILRTGFLTAKGNLVRSIMYPPPVDYKFEKDSYKFVAVLACIAFVGFVNSIFTKLAHGESLRNIIVDSLDLITIVVPPALPAAMTVGRMYAQRRLQKREIYCISPRAINVSGSINCVCFDKTGTLTEEGLDLWGTIPTLEGTTQSESTKDGTTETSSDTPAIFQSPIQQADNLSHGRFLVGMAACHSLTRIDGKLIGDPLDLKMFEWTNWTLEEPGVAENEKFDMVAPTIVRPAPREINDNNIHYTPSSELDAGRKSPQTDISGNGGAGGNENLEIGIVRQFPFSSSLQRMSVITRRLGASEFELYAKGSPEMISSLALPHTIPENFASTLERYTQQGYRVIALGHRTLPRLNYAKIQRVMRDEVEAELTFLGLIIMENRLKAETTGVIRILKNANIRTIMVTGDNMLTAISVARECGMLDPVDKIVVLNVEDTHKENMTPHLTFTLANKMNPMTVDAQETLEKVAFSSADATIETPSNKYQFACTGSVFSAVKTFYPDILPRLLVRGIVFARMSPEQKQQLVELLQGLGYFVGMCGDGANDCGALKAAHAGISLSEAESSVASPFTSKEANITCVPHLIREGRAALVTSFGIFKYMAVYSMTQFITVSILYTIGANLTDLQFLYIDLFLISIFALFFGHTKPYPGPLEKRPPSASLVSIGPIVSIVLHIITILGIQFLAFIYVQKQDWFVPFKPEPGADGDESFASYENYSLFTTSAFQYIIMAVVFSQGKPYRQSLVTNPGLLGSLLLMTGVTVYLVLWPDSIMWLQVNIFGFVNEPGKMIPFLPPNFNFRLILILFTFANFLIALLIEHGVVNFIIANKFGQKKKLSKTTKEYLRIEHDLCQTSEWPPLPSRKTSSGHDDTTVFLERETGNT